MYFTPIADRTANAATAPNVNVRFVVFIARNLTQQDVITNKSQTAHTKLNPSADLD